MAGGRFGSSTSSQALFLERRGRHKDVARGRPDRLGYAMVGDAGLPEREHKARGLETGVHIVHPLSVPL